MAHIDDLSPGNYFGEEIAQNLRAVGWLSSEVPFPTGRVERVVFEKLKSLLINPWQPFVSMGVHECEICQFDPPSGNANLFVPNGKLIFVCPELIMHYIAAHHYRPPDEFLAAVIDCPDTRTIEYKKLLLTSGGRALLSSSRSS